MRSLHVIVALSLSVEANFNMFKLLLRSSLGKRPSKLFHFSFPIMMVTLGQQCEDSLSFEVSIFLKYPIKI